MNTLSDLRTSLLDLLWEFRETELKLIIGGGYGIYLKTEYVRKLGSRTLLVEWPESRSTSDLDLFLRPEFLIHPEKLKPLSAAISKLGYQVVQGAEKYQFVKPGPKGVGSIKIDVLTGPRSRFDGTSVKADERRARPKPSVGLHAHPVDEVPTLEENLLSVAIGGTLSTGNAWECDVFLPHPYSFLMMKLFAFKDRLHDESKEYGRYHALDLYTILATTTEGEWNAFAGFRDRWHDEPYVKQAAAIIAEHFSALKGMGMVRLRESRYYRPELQLDDFMSILQEAFPVISV
jgi:hypothetical protein